MAITDSKIITTDLPEATDNLYHYKAVVNRVIDGDTFELESIDLGFGITLKTSADRKWKVRMLGINTKEIHSKDEEEKELAYEAKDFMTEKLQRGAEVIIKSHELDAFGRILADVWLNGEHLNKTLLDNGLAVEYMV